MLAFSILLALCAGPAGVLPATAIVQEPAPDEAPAPPATEQQPVEPPPPPIAPAPPAGWHPHDASSWEERFDASVHFRAWDGLELWADDTKTFRALEKALDAAWPVALDLLGGDPFPAGHRMRVVALKEEATTRAYFALLRQGARQAGVSEPPDFLLGGVLGMGSAHWNLPATVLLNPEVEGRKTLATRAVHEVCVVLAGWACSWSGYGAPEFLEEGFAGMVERRALDEPAALVYHDKAALKMTIHGYGVFAGIGAALNDASNAPGNWPGLVARAVDEMRDQRRSRRNSEAADPDQRVDRLLLRTHEEFARADYAYAWGVMEFLFRQPDDARKRLHAVLAEMRAPKYAALGQAERSNLFRSLLLAEHRLDGPALHEAFLAWAPEGLPD